MSDASNEQNDWQRLWNDYTKSFENWKQMFESIQKANSEMQHSFNQVIETSRSRTTMPARGFEYELRIPYVNMRYNYSVSMCSNNPEYAEMANYLNRSQNMEPFIR